MAEHLAMPVTGRFWVEIVWWRVFWFGWSRHKCQVLQGAWAPKKAAREAILLEVWWRFICKGYKPFLLNPCQRFLPVWLSLTTKSELVKEKEKLLSLQNWLTEMSCSHFRNMKNIFKAKRMRWSFKWRWTSMGNRRSNTIPYNNLIASLIIWLNGEIG